MQTVVEMPEFQRRAKSLLAENERRLLINYLASNPDAGVLLQGTGGVRKIRWAVGDRGKSGGVRVVYFYHDTTVPVFLLSVFGKSEKANLSKAEANQLAKLTKVLVEQYRSRR